MNAVFYTSAAVAVVATVLAITRRHPIHALLYLLVSLFATALIFFLLGAPFVAVLEVIIYAGAIVVLFVFVVMLLDLRPEAAGRERQLVALRAWLGPVLLAGVLAMEVAYVLAVRSGDPRPAELVAIGPKAVGLALYGPYLLGVEIASMLLLAGVVGAYHLGKSSPESHQEMRDGNGAVRARAHPGGDPLSPGARRGARAP